MPAGPDAPSRKIGREPLGLGRAHDEEVPDRIAPGRYRREREVAESCECVEVMGRSLPPLGVPTVEQRQLVYKHQCLKRVEPRGVALPFVTVLLPLAMLPERPDASSEVGVVRHERPGVAEGASPPRLAR